MAAETDQDVSAHIESSHDRRSLVDRRNKPTPFLSRYWLTGKRRAGRRSGETTDIYVDRYTSYEWLLVLAVFVLGVADLIFTLAYLASGGAEANPFMAWAYTGGSFAFTIVKIGVTTLCLLLLLIHVRFRRIPLLLAFAFLLYAGVFVYHRSLTLIMH